MPLFPPSLLGAFLSQQPSMAKKLAIPVAGDKIAHPATIRALQQRLITWYSQHGRDLPWRRTRDPYAILVSEVMLQQTQVQRALLYYGKFLTRYPKNFCNPDNSLIPELDLIQVCDEIKLA